MADPHVINRLAALRRMVDQHTSTSSQRICLELLKEGRVAEHLRGLIKAYRIREMQQSQHWSGMRRMKCIGPCLQAATIFGFPYRTDVRSSGCIGILPFPRRHVHAGQRVRR